MEQLTLKQRTKIEKKAIDLLVENDIAEGGLLLSALAWGPMLGRKVAERPAAIENFAQYADDDSAHPLYQFLGIMYPVLAECASKDRADVAEYFLYNALDTHFDRQMRRMALHDKWLASSNKK